MTIATGTLLVSTLVTYHQEPVHVIWNMSLVNMEEYGVWI